MAMNSARLILCAAVWWLLVSAQNSPAHSSEGHMRIMDVSSAGKLCERGWLTLDTEAGALFGSGARYPLDVRVDDVWLLDRVETVNITVTAGPKGGFAAHYETARGAVNDSYVPFEALGDTAWLRTLTYENTTSRRQDVLSARMFTQPLVMANTKPWNPRHLYMTRAAGGWMVGVAYRGTSDLYRYRMRDGAVGHTVDTCWRLEPGQSARIGDQVVWARHMDDGPAPDDRQWAERFRAEAQRFYAAIGIRIPEGMPDWVRSMVLYEYNAGGHIDSRFSDVGGFHRLAEQTAYLAELGVSAVWLQAVHQHKTPPNPVEGGWNLYDPLDFDVVEPFMGGEEGLRALCEGLRNAGIRILGGVVPHGGHSVQAKALPEWWSYERDGSPRRNWGGCGMDYASPEWQRIIADSMAWQARTFGFEGCRVDVADGSGPNWGSPRTHHASYSTLGGAVELLEALRDGMAESIGYPVLIPESFDQVEYFRVTPIGYGHDFWMFIHNQVEPAAGEPAIVAALLRDRLEEERGALPAGALTLRTLNNHDTVCEAGRVHARFGAGPARALHGVCLMIPGIPMLYQEQEIGDYYALRAMHRARRSIPEFTDTDAVDYFAVNYAPEVFGCLRGTDETGLALGLANLSGDTITAPVRFADRVVIPDGTTAYDGVSGRNAVIAGNAFSWSLGPYETALFRIGKMPEAMPDIRKAEAATPDLAAAQPRLVLEKGTLSFIWGGMRAAFHAGDDAWTLGADDGEGRTYMSGALELRVAEHKHGLRCELLFGHVEGGAWPALSIVGACEWLVSAQTALLRDQVLRRHYPWPDEVDYVWDKTMFWGPYPAHALYNRISPTGRLWESVVEPLHPAAPGLVFQDDEMRRIIIHDLRTDVHNVLLRDGVDIVPGGDGYGLRIEFRGHDHELAPHVDAHGLGMPFHVESAGPDTRAVYSAVFELVLASGGLSPVERQLHETARGNSNRHGFHMTLQGDNAQLSHPLGIVLPAPGAITWSGLPMPRGRYRLAFHMRHSESAPDGTDLDDAYEISVGGMHVAYEWVERNTSQHNNAYFGTIMTEAVSLDADRHDVVIATTRPWCMVGPRFTLHPTDE